MSVGLRMRKSLYRDVAGGFKELGKEYLRQGEPMTEKEQFNSGTEGEKTTLIPPWKTRLVNAPENTREISKITRARPGDFKPGGVEVERGGDKKLTKIYKNSVSSPAKASANTSHGKASSKANLERMKGMPNEGRMEFKTSKTADEQRGIQEQRVLSDIENFNQAEASRDTKMSKSYQSYSTPTLTRGGGIGSPYSGSSGLRKSAIADNIIIRNSISTALPMNKSANGMRPPYKSTKEFPIGKPTKEDVKRSGLSGMVSFDQDEEDNDTGKLVTFDSKVNNSGSPKKRSDLGKFKSALGGMSPPPSKNPTLKNKSESLMLQGSRGSRSGRTDLGKSSGDRGGMQPPYKSTKEFPIGKPTEEDVKGSGLSGMVSFDQDEEDNDTGKLAKFGSKVNNSGSDKKRSDLSKFKSALRGMSPPPSKNPTLKDKSESSMLRGARNSRSMQQIAPKLHRIK